MSTESQKTTETTTVRIWQEAKDQLQKVVRKRADKENRTVTEAEEVSKAVKEYYQREKRKLGIV